jgi:hypothetical protein
LGFGVWSLRLDGKQALKFGVLPVGGRQKKRPEKTIFKGTQNAVMKRYLMLPVLLFSFYFANCQQVDSIQLSPLQKQQLLSKAKTQKAVGWFMFGTGAPIALGSLLAIIVISKNDFDQGTAFGVLAGSTAYTLIGHSLIRKGNRNKKQALSLNYINFRIDQPFLANSGLRFQQGVSIRLDF